jgi:hypothetical protein
MNVRAGAIDDPLLAAVERLDGAMSRIEGLTTRLRARAERAESDVDEARNSDVDRARLAEALDAARGRESDLQLAAQGASDALDQAIGELRDMMAQEE